MCLSIKVNHPDHVLAEGEHEGLEWAITSNGIGFRCGYVRIPKGHPWHGKEYDDIPVDVHGGLTFTEADVHCDKGGEDDAWWIGFDCAHLGDAQDPDLPHEHALMAFRSGTIKTTEYVRAECESLCRQVKAKTYEKETQETNPTKV